MNETGTPTAPTARPRPVPPFPDMLRPWALGDEPSVVAEDRVPRDLPFSGHVPNGISGAKAA